MLCYLVYCWLQGGISCPHRTSFHVIVTHSPSFLSPLYFPDESILDLIQLPYATRYSFRIAIIFHKPCYSHMFAILISLHTIQRLAENGLEASKPVMSLRLPQISIYEKSPCKTVPDIVISPQVFPSRKCLVNFKRLLRVKDSSWEQWLCRLTKFMEHACLPRNGFYFA